MRNYQKEYNEYNVKCVICGQAWVPHARHVVDGSVEDCKPDNLRYLEYMLEKKEKKEQQ